MNLDCFQHYIIQIDALFPFQRVSRRGGGDYLKPLKITHNQLAIPKFEDGGIRCRNCLFG